MLTRNLDVTSPTSYGKERLRQQMSIGRPAVFDEQTAVEPDYYRPIKDKVLEARSRFLSWADGVPYPVNELIQTMSKSNRADVVPGALLGERHAFWMGELLEADEGLKQVASFGCIAGYTYFVHQDHLIDGDADVIRYNELARNLLYAKMLECFEAAAGSKGKFWGNFDRYLREYTFGCLSEAVTGADRQSCSGEDLWVASSRSAPVKICAASLALATGRESEIPKYDLATDYLVMGLQIRDDLADCVEDLMAGRYTYAANRILRGRRTDSNVLQRAMLYDDSVEMLIDESTVLLHRAADVLRVHPSTAMGLYLDYMLTQNREIKTRITGAKGAALLCPKLEGDWELPMEDKEVLLWDEIREAYRNDVQY